MTGGCLAVLGNQQTMASMTLQYSMVARGARCTIDANKLTTFKLIRSPDRHSCAVGAAVSRARPALSVITTASSASAATVLSRSRMRRRRLRVVATQPDPTIPETEKERSPLDYPQEWITPQPSRRPDIFPEFEKQAVPMPKPMPGDPELPDEDEEEEEKKKKEKEDPDKENPDEENPDAPAPPQE